MSDSPRRTRSTEAFFGRRHGKTIRPIPAKALAEGLVRYGLDLAEPPPAHLSSLFSDPVTQLVLEIGFGGGERFGKDAALHPDTGFMGVEPFVNGMAKLMFSLAETPLNNVRIYPDDATRLLDWLPPSSLDRVDLFYPDPWPKKKHWKRRFVNAANLARIARVLKVGGRFRFASDIGHYVNWTLVEAGRSGAFAWSARAAADWHAPYPGWSGTRYEAKALREGRTPCYLTFERVAAGTSVGSSTSES